MELSRYADLFLSESRAHVSAINHHLLELERSGSLAEVEEIFRSAHTLKGMSAAMGCDAAAELAHALEHLLDRLRGEAVTLDESVMEALFEGTDALEQTIAAELAGEGAPASLPPVLARVRLLGGDPSESETLAASAAGSSGEAAAAEEDALQVTVMIQAATALPAVRAMLVLRAAREIGEPFGVDPSEERLLAGEFSGTLRFSLLTAAAPEEVRQALLRAGDVAHVVVEENAAPAAEAAPLVEADPTMLSGGRTTRGADHFVRIEQRRLDVLVEHVGELVIARDRLHQLVAARGEQELEDASTAMSRLIAEVRDEVMGMRMAPIGEAFDRFPRFVRDTTRSLGKRVDFEITGRDAPLDRALHNELSDLLIHLLRNALDHGVETPEERAAAGKPETARVRLSAHRVREEVIVEVGDDGRGVSRERVKQAAVQAGLASRAELDEMDDEEVLHLLTRPGLSTAERVTDVSGRGVGLDVVASRVRALGGGLEIESEPGVSTTFSLRLPLSLAILRTLQVSAAGSTYVLPISAIDEVTELGAAESFGWTGDAEGEMDFRGERVPLLCLGAILRPGVPLPTDPRTPVVVLQNVEGSIGVSVDGLQGQHEAVLKPFDAPARMTNVFAGATILADGRPALILDGVKLGKLANRSPELLATHGSHDPS